MVDSTSTSSHVKLTKQGRPAPKLKAQLQLRDIPTSDRYFTAHSLGDYVSLQVRDKTYDGTNDRLLPSNEIDVLALNELAASEGQGFSMFLPSRHSWSRQTFEPRSRGPRPEDLRYLIFSDSFYLAYPSKGRLSRP